MTNRDGHSDKKGLGAIREYNEEPDLVWVKQGFPEEVTFEL